jgi:hypothetical protein
VARGLCDVIPDPHRSSVSRLSHGSIRFCRDDARPGLPMSGPIRTEGSNYVMPEPEARARPIGDGKRESATAMGPHGGTRTSVASSEHHEGTHRRRNGNLISALTRSVRVVPALVAALVGVAGLCGCANSDARSASGSASPRGATVSSSAALLATSSLVVGLAPPIPWVCGSVVSGSDLSGVASESGVIVEGTSPDRSSTFNDADASQFNVAKVLKAVPGVHPSGPIEIVFGPPNSGDFLPAGKYLLFLVYNAIGKDYSIASSSFENVLTVGEFLIDGADATEQRCATPVSSGTPEAVTASANAAASPPSLSASQLEGFVGQLSIGNAPGVARSSAPPVAAQTSASALASS